MAHHQPIRKQPTATRTDSSGRTPAEIPDKLYFRIGEVARLCNVPAYVLRFWESEFPQLKPNKGGTGQRLFRRRDVEMALRIKGLLYDEGYTIPGARQMLKAEAKQKEPQLSLLGEEGERSTPGDSRLHTLRRDLQDLLSLLEAPPSRPAGAAPAFDVRSGTRRGNATTPIRRAALIPVPSSEKLFDFPGHASSPIDAPKPQDDPL